MPESVRGGGYGPLSATSCYRDNLLNERFPQQGNTCDFALSNGPDFVLDLRAQVRFVALDAQVRDAWLIHWCADLADQIALCFCNRRYLCDHRSRETGRCRIIQFANVRNRILTRRSFERHGPTRRHQTIRAIAAPGLPVITGFRRRAADRQKEAPRCFKWVV